MCLLPVAHAQSPDDTPIPTLHVSADLVQVPTLVIDQRTHKPATKIDERKFSVSFDGGPKFHVTHARIEGDDPLSVAILLDVNRANPKVADQAIASLAPLSLHPTDSVSIYGMDCDVVPAPEGGPTDASALKSRVALLLDHEDSRTQADAKAKCPHPAQLMDTLAELIQSLSAAPGRRIILAITDGLDRGSLTSWNDVMHLAQSKSVTIFGLMSPPSFKSVDAERLQGPLNAVCQSSGGLVLLASGFDLAKELAWALTLTRSRYILEFPRPISTAEGRHSIQVTISEYNDMFIRPAGARFPTLTPQAFKDPNSVASNPALRPQLGKRKPVFPPSPSESAAVATPPTPDATPSPAPDFPNTAAASQMPSALAPNSPPSTTASTTLKVSTRLTIENVTVTDSRGRPVHGLTQADFTVKEDGKLQPIKNFEEFSMEKPRIADSSTVLPGSVSSNAPQSMSTASTAGTFNILLFDQVTTGLNGLRRAPDGFAYAKMESKRYLNSMASGTQIAILELGSESRVVQGFTTNRELLLAAVDSLAYKPVEGTYVYPPVQQFRVCMAANKQSELVLNGLSAIADLASGLEGKKNLMWFTPGVQWLTHYRLFRFDEIGCVNDDTLRLYQVYDRLAVAQIALTPIDPHGIPTDPQFGADVRGNITGPQSMNAAFGFMASQEHEYESRKSMAEATGGVPYAQRNDLDRAIADAIANGSYYSLAYVPPLSKYDDKYHTIQVKVDRPGLTLRYRTGYTSVDTTKTIAHH